MSTYRALWLNPELHDELVVHCKKNDIKVGSLIKELVKNYLEQSKTVEQNAEVIL